MLEVVKPEEEVKAQEAYAIMSAWHWGHYDPDGCFHSKSVPLDEALNRLAFGGHSDPKIGLLTLLIQGRLTAIANIKWAKFQRGDDFRINEYLAHISVAQWATFRAALAFKYEQMASDGWPFGSVDLPNLGFEDQLIADWNPEHNRCSFALKPNALNPDDPEYFEECFDAFDLAILPLVMPGPDGEPIGLGGEMTAEASRSDNPKPEKRGRPARYDWPAASIAVFGQIHRGDFKPESQADIERALIAHLTDADGGPSESTVRPYAKLIWEESQKA